MSVFQSAIRDPKDGTVDAGYLALFWSMIGWSISSGLIFVMGFIALYKSGAAEVGAVVQNTGIALGAVAAAFATVVGAVGLFRAGDRRGTPTPPAQSNDTVTQTTTQTTTTTP